MAIIESKEKVDVSYSDTSTFVMIENNWISRR